MSSFFFFQAEDGIRDFHVTGVQTCALPISDAPPPDGIDLVDADSGEDLRGVANVQWEAYGESGAVPQRAVDGLRRTVEAGGLVVLARDAETREPVGGGLCTGPYEGATELTSIGVRECFRRRGIAEAMTRRLAREMQGRGNG